MGYLMDIFFALAATFGQITFAVAACYFLYKSMMGIKPISRTSTVDQAMQAWLKQALMTMGMFVSMMLCSIDVLSIGIVVLCAGVAMAMFGLGVLQLRLVKRRLEGEPQAPEHKGGEADKGGEVLVQRLQPDRIRGISDEHKLVIFSAADLGNFTATRGRVRMLNLGFATRMISGGSSMLPIMSFSNDEGDSYLIYKDDYVVPA